MGRVGASRNRAGFRGARVRETAGFADFCEINGVLADSSAAFRKALKNRGDAPQATPTKTAICVRDTGTASTAIAHAETGKETEPAKRALFRLNLRGTATIYWRGSAEV